MTTSPRLTVPLLLIAFALCVLDAVQTYVALMSGEFVEANPAAAGVFGPLGLGPSLVLAQATAFVALTALLTGAGLPRLPVARAVAFVGSCGWLLVKAGIVVDNALYLAGHHGVFTSWLF